MSDTTATARLWAIIERDFTASLMNSTKWAEALATLNDLNVYYKIKLITETDPSPWFRHLQYGDENSDLPRRWVEGYYSPFPVLEIEWMEIQPIPIESAERIAEIKNRFQVLCIPFEMLSNTIRIVGHIRR